VRSGIPGLDLLPVVVRIVWEHDGEEHIETAALGWSGQKA
jgi:hypothetical protein